MRDILIHHLSIKGYARADILADAAVATTADVEMFLDALAQEEIIETTRMGAKLTEAGRAEAGRLLALQRDAGDGNALEAFHAVFEPLNAAYKAAIADWQLRPGPDGPVPNDHSDAAYDAEVRARMFAPHADLLAALAALRGAWPVLAAYGDRLAAALARVEAGELRYVAAPLIDSYHTVWFELHEALIRLSGRTRAAEAAAGRAV